MIPFAKHDGPLEKSYFTSGHLPRYIDPAQPPQTRKPFSSIWALKWCHTLDLILPSEVADIVQRQLADFEIDTIRYAKVIMSLQDIVEGSFFDEYIKKGNIMMLSEGRPGVDRLYSLHEGLLRIEVDTPTYERIGIVGKPIPDGGKKHKKSRYLIEINLRLPSMVSGKKAFDRMKWAFKTVLNESVTWLFCDVRNPSAQDFTTQPIAAHHPLQIAAEPVLTSLPRVLLPSTLHASTSTASLAEDDRAHLADLEEWLALVALGSPHVQADDRIDPYLSRYRVPTRGDSPAPAADPVADIVRLRWRGFLPSAAVVQVLVRTLKCRPTWAGWMAHGFRGECVTVLKTDAGESEGEEFMEWEHPARLRER